MIEAVATTTEMQNNFSKYLNMVMNGHEVIVTRNGVEVGRFVPRAAVVSYLTDSLTGILPGEDDVDMARDESRERKGF